MNTAGEMSDGTAAAVLITLLGTFLIAFIIYYVLQVIAYWKIFTKAGEKGWKSIIPFYNVYVQFKLTWQPLFFWIWLAITVVTAIVSNFTGTFCEVITVIGGLANFVIYQVMGNYYLSKSFGHNVGFTVGLIFLDPIFKLILGFSRDTYLGNTTTDTTLE